MKTNLKSALTFFMLVALSIQTSFIAQQKIDLTKADGNSASAKFTNRAIEVWENMKTTKYALSKDHVIDEKNGIYKYDGPGFVAEILLKKVLPEHYQDLLNNKKTIKKANGKKWNIKRPTVPTFYDYFRNDILKDPKKISVSNKYWKVFTSIDSLQKGDLIIARYHDKWRKEQDNNSTGLIWVAWNVEQGKKSNQFKVQVLSSSSIGHTKSIDTRYNFDTPVAEERKGKPSGIGFGKMVFKVGKNERKRPYAYTWSLTGKRWYNLVYGDKIKEKNGKKYDKLKGIIFARPI
ncbi:hypothetical protein [Polaribacter porphyrae]|uniref:Uncharacterized protein n=1 Tax=Polaribacter porphyrae TaxID=1137780 RepID=A0A2S7WQ36_9FLAO|nr:hypothetical protein [Polaribacter porphyrae]PQJ79717.1 hypothetical protein BTO18_11275 [Polaribacter porphyrae]